MNEQNDNLSGPQADDPGPPPRDELDALLRNWHATNAARAAAARERLVEAIRTEEPAASQESHPDTFVSRERQVRRSFVRRLVMNRYSPIAAVLILAAVLVPLLMPTSRQTTYASDVIMAPEGGRLDALDSKGNAIGPCPLKHTDVDARVSGPFTRVTVKQQYHNPYETKIEAVYTFPLSHRAAVDRMTMIIGERVVIGEVKERQRARAIYEAARQQGYVASLLEQERPNIFTQSVANIEPGAEIEIEISYVETLESKDGTYSFDFPMVVGPRYVPGSQRTLATSLPDGLASRPGIVLRGPAALTVGQEGDTKTLGTLQTGKLTTLLHGAVPIAAPGADWWNAGSSTSQPADAVDARSEHGGTRPPQLWYRFEATYCGGSKEHGTLHTDGTGQLNGRWFYTDPATVKGMGTGFAPDTTQVPDASRITPEPVRPGKRSGHDISVRVTIDTGGPGILGIEAPQHDIIRTKETRRDDSLVRRTTIELRKEVEIPNRDFVLTWKQTSDTIQEAMFTHAGKQGNFLTMIVQPPARVGDAQAVPRELVFVLDSSGSMSGFPIEKAKAVMAKAIDALRPQDTFNLITFSGDTRILWDKPRPFTPDNRAEAQKFLAERQGGGGTEMMKAINAALVQTPGGGPKTLTVRELLNLPADGQEVRLTWEKAADEKQPFVREEAQAVGTRVGLGDWIREKRFRCPMQKVLVVGHWATESGDRVLVIGRVEDCTSGSPAAPMRICCFMTDGYVGNDMEIIDAVKKNAATTRVFSFGIGNSVNRYLLDNMAKAGRGEVEYVLLQSDGDAAAKRFAQRIQTPVLTDIQVQFSDGLKVTDMTPAVLPDLFDVKPLILHGRYATPGKGTITIRGNTAAGPYLRTLPLDLPASEPEHDTIATLWARAKVEELMNRDLAAVQQNALSPELKGEIVKLGETFGIMTQFTSFVAVEKSRVTIGGEPKLVAVPVEMPQGVSYEGVFGRTGEAGDALTTASTARHFWSFARPRAESPKRFDLLDVEDSDGDTLLDGVSDDAVDYESFGKPIQDQHFYDWHEAGQSVPGQPVPGHAGYGAFGGAMMIAPPPPSAPRAVVSNGGVSKVLLEGRSSLAAGKPPISLAGDGFITFSPEPTSNVLIVAGGKKQVEQMREVVDAVVSDRPGSVLPQPQSSVALVPGGAKRGYSRRSGIYAESLDRSRTQTQPVSATSQPADLADEVVRALDTVRASKAQAWAKQSLLLERAAIVVDSLAREDKWNDAGKVAEAMSKTDPDFRIAARMRDVLKDEKLDASQRKAQIAALAAEARKPLEAAARDATLKHRLDEKLYRWLADKPEAPPPASVSITPKGALVSVLVRGTDRGTLSRLKQAGLSVEAVVQSSSFVVGRTPRDKLADLALLDVVRKIEPTE